MSVPRWLGALVLGVALIGGCKPVPKEEPPVVPSVDTVAAAKAKYLAIKGAVVGEVVSVIENLASVSGIDAKALKPGERVTFIDPANDQIVGNGILKEVTPSGHLAVTFDKSAQRPPRQGDLVVALK